MKRKVWLTVGLVVAVGLVAVGADAQKDKQSPSGAKKPACCEKDTCCKKAEGCHGQTCTAQNKKGCCRKDADGEKTCCEKKAACDVSGCSKKSACHHKRSEGSCCDKEGCSHKKGRGQAGLHKTACCKGDQKACCKKGGERKCCAEKKAGCHDGECERKADAQDKPKACCSKKACCQADAKGSKKAASQSRPKWISLFDGKTLNGWKITDFGGQGDVYVKDGQIILEMGADLTGITWTKPEILPKVNYEVSLDAMRVEGTDFFCGLTVPVRDEFCSLILGGWGGGVCGISCIDGMDASENDTTCFREFENKRWYHVRLRVTDKRIQAWVDDEKIIDQDIEGAKLSVRIEVDLSKPFGIASWQTTAALKNIRVRRLTEEEVKQTNQSKGL